MAKFINRKQMLKATDEEIKAFFSETEFKGVFSHEIKSKKEDRYKGNISEITLGGRPTDIIPRYLNVPKTSREIPEGPCSFKCRMNIDALKEEPSNYRVNIVGASLQSIEPSTYRGAMIVPEKVKEEDLFDAWGVGDCECIGYYHYDDESEVYIIEDLHKSNFDNIPYYPGDEEKHPIRISYPFPIRGIKLNDYYRFTWKLSHKRKYNPYEIIIDFENQPRQIEPRWFINNLFDDRHNDKSKNFGSANGYLDTLSKQLSAKDSTFIYELLQNANDYPVEGKSVDVEFHITDEYLLFLHTGAKFNVRNISGICGINEKEKNSNKKAIGYKGIGFKTVFLNNHYVYIRTGEYSFRFDEKAKKIKRLEAPWPILPVWTEHDDVSKEVNSVFDKADKKFQVKIALRPDNRSLLHDGRNSYEKLLRDTFKDSNVILFIPNINSVKVVINGEEKLCCLRNNAEWILGEYIEEIPPELQLKINKTIDDGKSRIPEKYLDFDITKVSFACKLDETRIIPIKRATLYCYLPTNASWGLPFLMNTDMIPKGDRNDIETEVDLRGNEKNFNEELACIAGAKLFSWIKDLLTSKKYDLCSIFSLIPNFEKCIGEHDLYKNYIECFRDEFENCIVKEKIVPVKQGIANIKKVIYDTTGLSSSGIMSDEEFIRFTEMDDLYLPLPCLRNNEDFNALLGRYVDEEQIFDKDCLTNLIANEDFQEWLKVQENNDKFLEFLLENGYLENLLGEEIFLEADGELYKASELYYDVDEFLEDLQNFTDFIPYLSPLTREHFKNNEDWERAIEGKFMLFDCDDFVNKKLLSSKNIEKVKERLKDKDTSIHFFKFLAENVRYCDKYLSLPFISDKNEIVDDFNKDFLFLTSDMAHKVFDMAWLRSVEVAFISPDYKGDTIAYFKKHFNVQDFSDNLVVEEIILSEDYKEGIIDDINEDYEISKSFVDYCYAQKELFDAEDLLCYPLKVYDGEGEEQWCNADDNIFYSSEKYDEYVQKEWLDVDWMYSLAEDYFDGVRDKENFREFLTLKFGVEELNEELFYTRVIKENIERIFDNTSGANDQDGNKNIDFVHYLDENYKLIFEEEKDYDKFDNFKPLSNAQGEEPLCDLSLDDNIYVYNKELEELLGNTWFPEDLVSLCNEEYGVSPALLKIGCKEYKFSEFYDDVIVNNLNSINGHIEDKETSIAFHTFIIDHTRSLTTEQQSKMVDAKVFLYGSDEAASSSSGHKIITAKARDLFGKGLVGISELDIIDPDYNTSRNREYWEKQLGNTKFTIEDFIEWINNNTKTICETLQDKDLNITFWRWIKDNAKDKDGIDELPILPVLLKDNTIDNDSPTIYLSDEYIQGGGIESLVRRYDENALFLCPEYIMEEDKLEEWKSFWLKQGIKYEIVDILKETIIPNLEEIEEEGLPKLIAENRETLEEHYDDGLIPHLKELRVKGLDGKFYRIDETIYIDCEKDEPFQYIELPNQISFSTSTADERKLIKDILDDVNGDCVATLSVWQQRKLDRYLEMQIEDGESIRGVHYQFINELSVITKESKERLKELEGIEKIKLLNRNNEFCDADALTMGSVYKPYFDFEGCGIDSLDYVNDAYKSNCEHPGKLFRSMNVHHDFQEEDIELLMDRNCAIYFWSQYLTKNAYNFQNAKQFIIKQLLNNVPCIPTKDDMKAPGELYYGEDVREYKDKLEDWENKFPFEEILRDDNEYVLALFDELPFRHSLDFLDSLYALIKVKSKEKRAKLLSWMIDDHNKSYDDKIEEYRSDENAKWYNNGNDLIQIKELYALDKSDKSLKILDPLPRIINNAYFPSDNNAFKRACDILKIHTITKKDLKIEPVDCINYMGKDVDLKVFALVIAGIIYGAEWRNYYDEYYKKLQALNLYLCKSMQVTYSGDESIYLSLGNFYNEDHNFYFVKSLDDKKVFSRFVNAYVDYLGIDRKGINMDLIMDIMDGRDSAVDEVKKYNSLMIDNEFKAALDELIPDIKQKLVGNIVDDTGGESPNTKEHNTGQQPNSADENSDEEEVDNGTDQDGEEMMEGDNDIEDEEVENAGSTKEHVKSGSATGRNVPNGSTHQSPISSRPTHSPHQFTQEEISRLSSNPNPLQLRSLPATKDEIEVLGKHGIPPEQIADTNYLAQLRLYKYLSEQTDMVPSESMEEFVRNAQNVSDHLLKDGRYIHACSAARGVMYISPYVWNKLMAGKCVVCVYLNGQGNNFHFIENKDEFLTLVQKDDIVIKMTGKEKVDVVNKLYSGLLKDTMGTVYTLVRVKAKTNIDAIFAPYVGEMAEPEDGNDENEYG